LLVGSSSSSASSDDIQAAVSETLFAMTPSPTAAPTNVPVQLTVAEHNPYLGPDDAPITMVEFSDYWCTYCGRFHAEVLEPLLDHYGDYVKFVYREYPVIGGQSSATIGSSAQCANLQGKYWEFTEMVWTNTTGDHLDMNDELLTSYATIVELDLEEYEACLEAEIGINNVNTDYAKGLEYDITGTPTFFINGERHVGAQPIEYFMDVIDQQLLDLGIQPPQRS
jgi:protein-disulfide isomerase